ncbi:MAG: hypothetical protein LBJ87_14740, partial [bacterium]|nr:hypothetical protein [bacterium]
VMPCDLGRTPAPTETRVSAPNAPAAPPKRASRRWRHAPLGLLEEVEHILTQERSRPFVIEERRR